MRSSFDNAFKIVIGLEGAPTNDPDDPGGYTRWGLASRYNPTVNEHTTLDEAKSIYLNKYWIPAGCDTAPFPMDICLFDARVNPQDDPSLPGGSMQELLNLHPENWQDYLIFRMQRYKRCSKPKYVNGHINRILKLHAEIKGLK
jgi:lysozyme family protein